MVQGELTVGFMLCVILDSSSLSCFLLLLMSCCLSCGYVWDGAFSQGARSSLGMPEVPGLSDACAPALAQLTGLTSLGLRVPANVKC